MADRAGALRRFVDLDEQEAHDLLVEAWARHDDAWKQVETFGPGRMAAYCLEARGISDDESIAQLTQEFEEASLKAGVEAVDGAGGTLAALHEANLRLALVCDTGFTPGRVVRRLLDDAGLLSYLEVLCFSDEVGVPKPGNEIFAKALAEVGAGPRGDTRGGPAPDGHRGGPRHRHARSALQGCARRQIGCARGRHRARPPSAATRGAGPDLTPGPDKLEPYLRDRRSVPSTLPSISRSLVRSLRKT